jgi:hypothetical protein
MITSFFNGHVHIRHIRVLLTPVKCIAKFVRGPAENPQVRYVTFEKKGKKKGGEGASGESLMNIRSLKKLIRNH